jgi:hypothetical protein
MAIRKTNQLRFCPLCNTELTADNFYLSDNPHHGGYLLYCKKHVDEINREYKQKCGGDQVKALWYTCAEIGIPFVLDVYRKFAENKDRKIKERQEKIDVTTGNKLHSPRDMVDFIQNYKDAFWYIDTKNKMKVGANDWSCFLTGTDMDWTEVSRNIRTLDVRQSEKENYILSWGLQDTADDYKFLDETFAKYTKNISFINFQQEDLYRDLCRDRLLLRKINDGRYKGDETIDKIQNRIAKTMSILKVDQFEETRPKTASEQSFFARIAQIENTRPCDLYKEPNKYKDFNKIQRYEKDMCLRPLLNTLCGQRDFNIDIDDVERYNMDCDEEE